MKKLFILLVFAITVIATAQAPQGFNYQATVRNSAGALIVNQNVNFKFNIMLNSQTSVPIYSETHFAPTDDLGQVNLTVGTGTPTTGTFSAINWAAGSYFLGIELNTGSGYVAMGTTQLLSVPYALYANSAGNIIGSSGMITPVLITNQIANYNGVSAELSASVTNVIENQIIKKGFVIADEANPFYYNYSASSPPNINYYRNIDAGFGIGNYNGYVDYLNPNTTYYVRAYAITENNVVFYGNEVSFTTSNVLLNEGFNELTSMYGWTSYSVTGAQVWTYSATFGNPGGMIKMSGFANVNNANEDWFITPTQNLSQLSNAILSFDNAYKYSGNPIQVLISSDYPGTGNPNFATWTPLSATLSAGNFIWTSSGSIDISAFTGVGNENVYIAFRYTSTTTAAPTWEIDNVKITTN
jgi:hypothetical protein